MVTRVRGRGEVELRAFALADMVKWGYDGLRGLAPSMSEQAVRGIPAMHRAARMRAEAIAVLRLRCWRGEGADKERIDNSWQAKLFAGNPNDEQTRFGFWETVGESLAWRANAYIWKNVDPLSNRVIDWWALHPDQVKCNPDTDSYTVQVRKGYLDPVGNGPGVDYHVDDTTILHIRGYGDGGKEEAPSPIQVFREALTGPVERQRHEGRLWRRGTTLQAAVTFPPGITQKQAEEWKESYRSAYEGSMGETTMVVGGGATITPIGMTQADSKFVEMAHLTVEDASRIMGVPANLLGAPTMTGTTKPTLEEDLSTWFRFGLSPELERIESALSADEQLFGTFSRSIYPAFDSDQFVRGDLTTEADILQGRVQAGILTPDEARRILGYDPLPGGVGQTPQITPVGGAPNPSVQPSEPSEPGTAK